MEGHRVIKNFESNDKEGEIFRWSSLRKVPFDMTGNWMVLARINDVKKELQGEAKNMGLYFQDMKGNKSFDMNQWKAIQDLGKICDGGAITREDACNMYNYLLNIDHGYRSADSKKWSFAHPNQVFDFDQLHLQGGMVEDKTDWQTAFRRKFKDGDKKYFVKLIDSGANLDDRAPILIDTIHQVKGGEADNVVLSSKCNFPSHFDRKSLIDKIQELRVWYTGVTRTINTLHLLGTFHKYNFPLSKYYKLYKSNYVSI